MTTKHYSEDKLQVSESVDKNMVAVSVQETAAGSLGSEISFFIFEPYLRGGDYPSLVQAWDNKEDDIYDTL